MYYTQCLKITERYQAFVDIALGKKLANTSSEER